MSLFLRLSDIQTSKHPAKGNSKGSFFDKYLSIILFTSSSQNIYDHNAMFPVLSNQKYNEHLKELGKLAGLKGEWIDYEFRLQEKIEVRIPKEDLASHTARRTFVVTAYNEGVPLDLIMLITSHSDVKAMKPYLKGNLKGSNRVIEALNKASH